MLWCELHNSSGVKGGITNFDPTEYEKDLQHLSSVTQARPARARGALVVTGGAAALTRALFKLACRRGQALLGSSGMRFAQARGGPHSALCRKAVCEQGLGNEPADQGWLAGRCHRRQAACRSADCGVVRGAARRTSWCRRCAARAAARPRSACCASSATARSCSRPPRATSPNERPPAPLYPARPSCAPCCARIVLTSTLGGAAAFPLCDLARARRVRPACQAAGRRL